MFLDDLEIPGVALKVATFHRNGGNFGPEWVATFKRNGGSFAPDYAARKRIQCFSLFDRRISPETLPGFLRRLRLPKMSHKSHLLRKI